MKKIVYTYGALAVLIILVAGVTYAAFSDRGNVLGSTFTVGSADIKLLKDVTGGTGSENLAEELPGPSFSDISPNWSADYKVKIFNSASTPVTLTTNSYYETVNDPADLRSIIFIEPILWEDNNGDGVVDAGELGASYGRKTIIKWKTEGFNLGPLAPSSVRSLILRLSTDAVSETKQGASALFDFQFNSVGL